MNSVKRYTVGVVDPDGYIKFATNRQGQHMKATPEEAQIDRDNMLKNNSPKLLEEFYGTNDPAKFIVCEVMCYPNHFDPKSGLTPWKWKV